MPTSLLHCSPCLRRLHIPCDACLQAMLAFASLAVAAAGSGCGTALLSARSPLQVIPASQEAAMGIRAYEQLFAGEPTAHDEQLAALVNRVGQRLAAAADKPEFDWEFRVITSEEMHAFALPGGKVAVSEGLLPVCQDEAGLAVVLSHEMAHALARHGSERLNRPAVDPGLRGAVQTLTRPAADTVTPQEIMHVYGAASKPRQMPPYSRKHEAEADAIGLILMAKAGYDPSVAPEFWERLSRRGETNDLRWTSTHPADARRIAQLRAMLAVAMNYYHAAPEQIGLGDVLPISGGSPQSLASAATQPREPEPREEVPIRVAKTSTVSRQASEGVSDDDSHDADAAPLNDWVPGSNSPQTPRGLAANGVARVRSEDSSPAWGVAQDETAAPPAQLPQTRSVEPAVDSVATAPPAAAGDDVFYPPIAIGSAADRSSAPLPLPNRSVPPSDGSGESASPQ